MRISWFMNNRIRTYRDRDITIHRNIRKYLSNIQILLKVSLHFSFNLLNFIWKFYVRLVKWFVRFHIKNLHVHFYISYLNSIFRIDMECTKMPFQDLIAAEISIASEDTVDCQARKRLWNWSLLASIFHNVNIKRLRKNSCNVFCFHHEWQLNDEAKIQGELKS